MPKHVVSCVDSEASKLILTPVKSSRVRTSSVEFIVGSQKFVVSASREVIIAAGTFKTPQLELSGIGNPKILGKFGIKPEVVLPGVGENLQDHFLSPSEFLLKEPAPLTYDAERLNATFLAEQVQRYKTSHDGLLASGLAMIGYHPLQLFVPKAELKAMIAQLDAEFTAQQTSDLHKAQFKIQRKLLVEGRVAQFESLFNPSGSPSSLLPNRSYVVIPALSAHINSSNPLAAPLIDPRYFSLKFDMNVMMWAVKVSRKIASSEPFASIVEAPSQPPVDVDFESWVRKTGISAYHPAGTAALAPRALGGVVAPNLCVYGTTNVRVADASVIPMIPAAHLQSTVYAIGEKASDLIRTTKCA